MLKKIITIFSLIFLVSQLIGCKDVGTLPDPENQEVPDNPEGPEILENHVLFTADGVTFSMGHVPGGYTFPIQPGDHMTGTVDNEYWIGETEVTYELWSIVYNWATSGSGSTGAGAYIFQNPGVMGDGTGDTLQHPVTTISWRDCMVWCNAITEWYNAQTGSTYTTVYNDNNTPIQDSRDNSSGEDHDTSADICDAVVVDAAADGFRLMTHFEFELAARWRDDSTNTVAGYSNPWFTKGNSASGATSHYNDLTATKEVAWYYYTSGHSAREVKRKKGNALGLYDMSGNVRELGFDPISTGRALLSSTWESLPISVQLAAGAWWQPYYVDIYTGFRLARSN